MGVGVHLHCTDGPPPHTYCPLPLNPVFVFFPVLNELFNLRHIITEEECSEVAEQLYTGWSIEHLVQGYMDRTMGHLVLVLAVKPVDAVEEATQVMNMYGFNTQWLHGELLH